MYKEKAMSSRIEYLDRTSKKRKSVSSELASSLVTLDEMVAHGETLKAISNVTLFSPDCESVMRHVLQVGLSAREWASNIEEQLLSGLDDAGKRPEGRPGGNHPVSAAGSIANALPSSTNASSHQQQMERLRKQAEVSLALFVSAQSPEERSQALGAIDSLLEVIQRDLEIAGIRRQEVEAKQLTQLKDYLLQGKAYQLQDASNIVSESDISEFEETLFSFLGTLTELESMPREVQFYHPYPPSSAYPNASSSNISTAPQSREQKANKLFGDTETLRVALASARIKLEKHLTAHPEDQSTIHLLNRITDVQEHLVEVQYQLKTKYMPLQQVQPQYYALNNNNTQQQQQQAANPFQQLPPPFVRRIGDDDFEL